MSYWQDAMIEAVERVNRAAAALDFRCSKDGGWNHATLRPHLDLTGLRTAQKAHAKLQRAHNLISEAYNMTKGMDLGFCDDKTDDQRRLEHTQSATSLIKESLL